MIARIPRRSQGTLFLLTGLLLVALVLDTWQTAAQRAGGQAWFERVVCDAAAPVQAAVGGAIGRLEDAWAVVAQGRSLLEENERLVARVAGLEQALALRREAAASSSRRSALREAYPDLPESGGIADVIGLAGSGWSSSLVIGRGSADDVRRKDVALTADGVVGQVYAVAGRTARVLPITDPASAVAVRIWRSRETGILKGGGPWTCEVRYLSPNADVRVGDEVVTAGTGGVYPKGLRVGKVLEVSSRTDPPEKTARVRPAANLPKVEEVLLLRAAAPRNP